jgi:pyruvate formate lyase activating enzyme
MKEALLYEKLDKNRVRCNLCAHRCVIRPGNKGICQVRENNDGILYTKVYGKTIARHVDPIEKKPFYHFYPGSKAYSIATPGCNFHCLYCQNWDISQIIPGGLLDAGFEATPEQIIRSAEHQGCAAIAYTYTEPTIFYEYSYDTARIAHQAGIKNVYVSNGFMTPEMLEMISHYLDAVNIDLKAFRDQTYRRLIGARLQPILENLKKIKELGIWLEVTSLIIPGLNDDPEEIRDMADYIAAELGTDVPWHLSRFFPAYKMKDTPPTPLKTLQEAKEAGLKAGLEYVFVGNVPSEQDMNTYSPQCGEMLIRRMNFGIISNRIKNGQCPNCETKIAGVGL